jgi:hypothetical protein
MQKGRQTYLSEYLDQSNRGLRMLSERDQGSMKGYLKRIRERAVYFVVDHFAMQSPVEELERIDVFPEGFSRPPFEVVVLAFDAVNTEGTTTPTLIFIDSHPDNKAATFYYSTCYGGKGWTVPILFWDVPFDGSMFRHAPEGEEANGTWQTYFTPEYALMDEVDRLRAEDNLTVEQFISSGINFSLRVFMNYICFCNILHNFHTTFEDNEPHKGQAKMRRALGKGPLFSYKMLTIGKPKRKSRHLGGTHASPRSHLRRGHYRTSSKGARYWVQPCMVKGETDGFVHKDYVVEGAIECES